MRISGFTLLLISLLACKDNADKRTAQPAEEPTSQSNQASGRCSRAVNDAGEDYRKGNYTFHSLEFLPTENSYLDVLQQRYHIHWQFVADMVAGGYYSCYDSAMVILLKQKYGHAFLKKAHQQADSLDETGTWNGGAHFAGGDEKMQQFLYQQVNWEKAPPIKSGSSRVFISFQIDSTGLLREVKVNRGIADAYDKEALRVVQHMPRWTPAYRQGHPNATAWVMPVDFSEERFRKYKR
ncbi:energy transducer TonB [Hymenobacter sp. J193]|uniref:energy transducer TonB n=1 Tax=Hymenobacter sp. J193 TaxID=2898429 RepID=UPI002150A74C|nr:energy transducer TonB [Hymenobacter sp. J193]MCR5890168.1 energy transducer TonB [Hymenobacter sp. J193]